jgi:hypothetical protein
VISSIHIVPLWNCAKRLTPSTAAASSNTPWIGTIRATGDDGVISDNSVSGAKGRKDRPGLDALLKGVARREFDMVAAWSVDRLGRSVQDLIEVLGDLHAKGLDLYLHHQGLDTSTPSGRAMYQMMGVFAEFERAIIRERVLSGLARAKAEGAHSAVQPSRMLTQPRWQPSKPSLAPERVFGGLPGTCKRVGHGDADQGGAGGSLRSGTRVMLGHACGYTLANKGLDTRTPQAYLGHPTTRSPRWRRAGLKTSGAGVGVQCVGRRQLPRFSAVGAIFR